MMPPERARVVLMTAPSMEVAAGIVRALVAEGVIACGNLVPGVTSIYRWEGEVEQAEEVLAILKTTETRIAELQSKLVELHPYDVPELLALPVMEGHPPYLDWLQDSTRSAR